MKPGQIYRWMADAVAESGSLRSVYSQDTTLSRRGLLTRGDRRAKELASLGVRPGQIVALSMGNVVEFLVLLLATSKVGAIAMPVDPANGDRMLLEATSRVPVRAVVRRPRGLESSSIDYPHRYGVRSRKRLSGSLLTVDALEPPTDLADVGLPDDTELLLEARGIGGVVRDIARSGAHLRSIGEAASAALKLDPGTRLLCAEPFTVPRFFDPVVLGWLASEAQLIMAEGPALDSVLPIAGSYEDLVVVDSVRQFNELGRSLKAAGKKLDLTPVIPEATVPIGSSAPITEAFTERPRQLLLLEEIGVLAVRIMTRGEAFSPAPGIEIEPGSALDIGGHEVVVRTPQSARTLPETPAGEPGALAETDCGWHHTGYAGKFGRSGKLVSILGRSDGLVNLEGRRACLDSIEEVSLEHRRLTWARATLEHTAAGEPQVRLEYRATGETPVDDIEEHAVGHLPPFMVPRAFERVG